MGMFPVLRTPEAAVAVGGIGHPRPWALLPMWRGKRQWPLPGIANPVCIWP
jgi:hypothetical protein